MNGAQARGPPDGLISILKRISGHPSRDCSLQGKKSSKGILYAINVDNGSVAWSFDIAESQGNPLKNFYPYLASLARKDICV